MDIRSIIIKPHVTEKSMSLTNSGVYTFLVDRLASKAQITSAVEELFGVKVDSVTTVVRKGKTRRVGKKMKEKTQTSKKVARVHVIKGKIDLFPQT